MWRCKLGQKLQALGHRSLRSCSPYNKNPVGVGRMPEDGVHVAVIAAKNGNQRETSNIVDVRSQS